MTSQIPAWLTIVIARSAPMLIIFIDQALPRCPYGQNIHLRMKSMTCHD
jgi:hypothetical protein